jgi:hypothetical protein
MGWSDSEAEIEAQEVSVLGWLSKLVHPECEGIEIEV